MLNYCVAEAMDTLAFAMIVRSGYIRVFYYYVRECYSP